MEFKLKDIEKELLSAIGRTIEDLNDDLNSEFGIQDYNIFNKSKIKKHNRLIVEFLESTFICYERLIKFIIHRNNLTYIRIISDLTVLEKNYTTLFHKNFLFEELFYALDNIKNYEAEKENIASNDIFLVFMAEHIKCIPRSMILLEEDERYLNSDLMMSIMSWTPKLIYLFTSGEINTDGNESVLDIIKETRKTYDNKYSVAAHYNVNNLLAEFYHKPS